MSEFSMKCPHCQLNLSIPSSMVNEKTECPDCGKSFIIDKTCLWRSRYFWGYLYMKSCAFLAILVALVAIYFCTDMIINTVKKLQNLKKEYKAAASEVVNAQKDFEIFYTETVNLLQKNNSFSSKSQVSGFNLPRDITKADIVFGEHLMSASSIQQSQAALKEYSDLINKMKISFRNELLATLAALAQKADIETNQSKFRHNNSAKAFVVASGRKVDFYNNEKQIEGLISDLKEETLQETKNLLPYVTYIEENLLSNRRVIGMGAIGTEKKQSFRYRRLYYRFVDCLNMLASIETDQEYWKLASHYYNLKYKITDLSAKYIIWKDTQSDEIRALCSGLVKVISKTLGIILAIMLSAALLKGFFDMSYNSFFKRGY